MFYLCPPEIEWAVEPDGVLLINQPAGKTVFLTYPRAAVWDLFSRGYGCDKVIELVSIASGLSPDRAAGLINETALDLAAAGFLEKQTADD